jgi:hypothetical protein
VQAYVAHVKSFYDKGSYDGAFDDHGSPQTFTSPEGVRGDLRSFLSLDVFAAAETCGDGRDNDCDPATPDACAAVDEGTEAGVETRPDLPDAGDDGRAADFPSADATADGADAPAFVPYAGIESGCACATVPR